MHIAITYPFSIGMASGGARMTREIAMHLGRLGVQVTLLPVSSVPGTRYPRPQMPETDLGTEFDTELAAAGVSIRRVHQHPAHWLFDGLQVRQQVRALLDEGPLDAVLSYYMDGAYLPGLLRSNGVHFGFISTWQSYALALDENRRRPPLQNWIHQIQNERLVRYPHRQAEILFPTSAFTRGELVDLLGVETSRTRVCYLGVQPEFLQVTRPEREEISSLIFFGRLVVTKGVQDALEALAMVKARGLSSWRFRMFGQGNRKWVKRVAGELGIADQVDVLPAVADRELLAALSQADLAVMPSHAEAFGLSVAEAQAAGLPVIAYAAGSVPEVVADGETAWLAPFRDTQALADRIEAALRDPVEAQRRGAAGRERVARLFTWERTAQVIVSGLEEIL